MEAREFELMRGVEDHMWWYRAVHSNVISSLDRNVGTGESVLLDAGCGTGGLLRRLTRAKPGWILVGLDAAPQALARAVAGRGPGSSPATSTAFPSTISPSTRSSRSTF